MFEVEIVFGVPVKCLVGKINSEHPLSPRFDSFYLECILTLKVSVCSPAGFNSLGFFKLSPHLHQGSWEQRVLLKCTLTSA